jgi:hypothetical protein
VRLRDRAVQRLQGLLMNGHACHQSVARLRILGFMFWMVKCSLFPSA